jgi:hypothetical protein
MKDLHWRHLLQLCPLALGPIEALKKKAAGKKTQARKQRQKQQQQQQQQQQTETMATSHLTFWNGSVRAPCFGFLPR